MLRASVTLAFAIALLAALATGATGKGDVVSLNVTVEGDAYAFTVEGLTGENPEIELPAGGTVTITFVNNGEGAHNLVFGAPISKATALLEPGASETLTFPVPANATGTTTYYCEPHQFQGMEGVARFKAAATPPPSTPPADPTQESSGGDNGIPALSTASALAAAAVAVLLARRR